MIQKEYDRLNMLQFKVYSYFVANTDLRKEDLKVKDLNTVASRIDWSKVYRKRRKPIINLVRSLVRV